MAMRSMSNAARRAHRPAFSTGLDDNVRRNAANATRTRRYLLPDAAVVDWSPDGATRYDMVRGTGIVARTLATGQERTLDHINGGGQFSLSPDGSEIVTFAGPYDRTVARVSVVPVAGGPQRELFRLHSPWSARLLEWTPDGRYVLLAARRSRPMANVTWLVPVAGGEPRRIEGLPPQARDVKLHPSGRRVVFMMDNNRSEVWVLERTPDSERSAPGR